MNTPRNHGPDEFPVTAEAAMLLEQTLADLRLQIMSSARQEQLSHNVAEISPSEMRSAISKAGLVVRDVALAEERQKKNYVRVATWMLGAPATFAAPLIVIYVLTRMGRTNTDQWISALGVLISTITAAGAVVLAVRTHRSLASAKYTASRAADTSRNEAELLQEWAELEATIRARVRQAYGAESADKPFRTVLMTYAELTNLHPAEVEQLVSILRVRNSAAHSPIGGVDQDALKQASSVIAGLLDRIAKTEKG